jgi:ubiquinone biosynthesis protein COQ4
MTDTTLPILPENPSLLTRVRLGYKALLVAKDDPANPEAGARINDCFEQEVYVKLAEMMRAHPIGKQIMEERLSLEAGDVDLEALENMPEGTLGHELAVYYRENHIAPFSTDQPLRNDIDYISKRYRETHDIYHLLTGYGTDVMGEMELQAFVRGNLGIRAPLMILPFGFLASRFGASIAGSTENVEPFALTEYVSAVRAAKKRGESLGPLIAIRFEDHWERPVEDLRREFLDAGDAPTNARG